jgi:hypothetical protein
MLTLEQIEDAILKLTPDEFEKLLIIHYKHN